MSDAGETLVDADARLQERLEEHETERRRRRTRATEYDPTQLRERESLRLARTELRRQAAATVNTQRRRQIDAAIGEIDRRLSAVG
jgi:hypothetical protein